MQQPTAGWHLCVQWLDGTTTWQTLKDLKKLYLVQVAEYLVMQGIDDEPAFDWWENEVLKKHERIIKQLSNWRSASSLKLRFLNQSKKYMSRLMPLRKRWKMSD